MGSELRSARVAVTTSLKFLPFLVHTPGFNDAARFKRSGPHLSKWWPLGRFVHHGSHTHMRVSDIRGTLLGPHDKGFLLFLFGSPL